MGNQHEFGRCAYAVPAEQIGGIEPNAVHARLGAYKENAPARTQTAAQWLTEAPGMSGGLA